VRWPADHLLDELEARLVFAVEGMGTRVAMIETGTHPPSILLAGHLKGERRVLVYRVADLGESMHQLELRGWKRGRMLEIPHGPICTFATPGGHRLAIYQLTRPEVADHFAGRRDF
jgi:hypothetical protein